MANIQNNQLMMQGGGGMGGMAAPPNVQTMMAQNPATMMMGSQMQQQQQPTGMLQPATANVVGMGGGGIPMGSMAADTGMMSSVVGSSAGATMMRLPQDDMGQTMAMYGGSSSQSMAPMTLYNTGGTVGTVGPTGLSMGGVASSTLGTRFALDRSGDFTSLDRPVVGGATGFDRSGGDMYGSASGSTRQEPGINTIFVKNVRRLLHLFTESQKLYLICLLLGS